MKERPTILIFTDDDRVAEASALKEEMLSVLPDAVVIIIDDLELYADALKDFLEKVFGIPANIQKRLAKFRESRIRYHVDEVGVSDNTMKGTEPYKRMLNIVNRYSPELVVSVGFGAFNEAVAVRDSGLAGAFKVAAYISDYALNRQLVNSYIDAYIVTNMAVKTSLVNSKIPEEKIFLAEPAVMKSFSDGLTKEAALKIMKLPSDKPVLTAIALKESDLELYQGADFNSVTPLAYTGECREAYTLAINDGFYAYNEGVSPALLYAASDCIITPPESSFTAAAFLTGKIVALTKPRDNLEKLNAVNLKKFTESVTDGEELKAFLSKFTAGELSPRRPPKYHESAGAALLKVAYNLPDVSEEKAVRSGK